MPRKNFILIPPYREITLTDASQIFTNELFDEHNALTLADLVGENHGQKYVIVYEQNGNVLAFLLFEEKESHIYLNLVATNRSFPSQLHPGTKLVQLLDDLTTIFNHNRIELYSVDDKISYYERLGYQRTNVVVYDPGYGKVTKMVKLLPNN